MIRPPTCPGNRNRYSPLGRPEDSELVVHHLLDRFRGADLTETLSRIKGTERESVSEGSAAMDLAHRA